MSSRRSRAKRHEQPLTAAQIFVREVHEAARRVLADIDAGQDTSETWGALCDLVEDYRAGKKIAGIDPR